MTRPAPPSFPRYTVDQLHEIPELDDAELLANAQAALFRNVWSPLARETLTEVVARFGRQVEQTDPAAEERAAEEMDAELARLIQSKTRAVYHVDGWQVNGTYQAAAAIREAGWRPSAHPESGQAR